MVQPRFLVYVAIIVVLTVLDCNNCYGGITKNRDGFISTSDLAEFDRKKTPIKWLKWKVKNLTKKMGKKLYNRKG